MKRLANNPIQNRHSQRENCPTNHKQLHNAERICLLLATLPSDVCDRIMTDLSRADRNLLNDTAQRLAHRPQTERRRLLMEALHHPRLAAILAQGEVERLNQVRPLPEPKPKLRNVVMEWLDPRIWFRMRKI